MMQHALAPQMNTQFTVTYQRKNGEIARQTYYVDNAEAAKSAFLKYVFGMTETNIVSIVDSTPPAADERKWQAATERAAKIVESVQTGCIDPYLIAAAIRIRGGKNES